MVRPSSVRPTSRPRACHAGADLGAGVSGIGVSGAGIFSAGVFGVLALCAGLAFGASAVEAQEASQPRAISIPAITVAPPQAAPARRPGSKVAATDAKPAGPKPAAAAKPQDPAKAEARAPQAAAKPSISPPSISSPSTSSPATSPSRPAATAPSLGSATANPAAATAPQAPSGAKVSKPYFIEFRARSAQSYGHTFAVHGRVGQKITAEQVVGLHPATESPIPWMIGHLVLVPSETGASDGDTEDQYIIARYRIALSEPEYRKVLAFMKNLQASSPVWHAVLYNCNAFVADIAKSMGLRTPTSTMLMPKEFINTLKSLNTSTQRADAPGAPTAR